MKQPPRWAMLLILMTRQWALQILDLLAFKQADPTLSEHCELALSSKVPHSEETSDERACLCMC